VHIYRTHVSTLAPGETHTVPTEWRQLLSTRCTRRPAGRCHAVEGRIGVCLSEAQRMGFFTWSLHDLSTAGFLLWRPRFGARLVYVRFLVYEVANGIGFALPIIDIPPKLQSSIVCRSLFCSSIVLTSPPTSAKKKKRSVTNYSCQIK
jgi:hypothetical protein